MLECGGAFLRVVLVPACRVCLHVVNLWLCVSVFACHELVVVCVWGVSCSFVCVW